MVGVCANAATKSDPVHGSRPKLVRVAFVTWRLAQWTARSPMCPPSAFSRLVRRTRGWMVHSGSREGVLGASRSCACGTRLSSASARAGPKVKRLLASASSGRCSRRRVSATTGPWVANMSRSSESARREPASLSLTHRRPRSPDSISVAPTPRSTGSRPDASTVATKSDGAATRTPVPSRDSDRATASVGMTSPRVPNAIRSARGLGCAGTLGLLPARLLRSAPSGWCALLKVRFRPTEVLLTVGLSARAGPAVRSGGLSRGASVRTAPATRPEPARRPHRRRSPGTPRPTAWARGRARG